MVMGGTKRGGNSERGEKKFFDCGGLLDQADEQAALSPDNETRRSVRAWEAFDENAASPSRPEHTQMKLVEELQETLQTYREIHGNLSNWSLHRCLASLRTEEALLRQSQIAALEAPKKRARDVAQSQFYDDIKDEFGQVTRRRPILAGLAESRLANYSSRDLVAVRRPAEKDLLSRFLQDHWMFKVILPPTGPILPRTGPILPPTGPRARVQLILYGFLTDITKTTKVSDETEYIKEHHVA
ncbi:hypothetical protein B0T26DRAFT_384377 [Lasiosphaeria miniovina]|uniref:Uncharacterized protein n=1 Tax=Lasiosphaeria miniovina TaxID=1954250 RepID=A0AA40DUW4_9PEZI|nr:uncharacterized protein B0T26DRAFT_384377 [Lasiosphaeria miniovina]KAK0714066.1 hypothetical protein B0T26DRAFT_384377 [Lasiosphaeria miniovina]